MGNPKTIKKLETDIKNKTDQIDAAAKLTKKWAKLTGPMTPKDKQILASGKHGTHGKVTYEKAIKTMETNLTQARNELKKLEEALKKEKG